MLKTSRLFIKIRSIKALYGTYISAAHFFSFCSYKNLQGFILFLGYPRSGSSTLGSLLDAHEHIILSHELNALQYISNSYNRNQLFYLIKKNSRLFNKSGRKSSGYKGIIEGQMNGQAKPLRYLGDKKAGGTTLMVSRDQEILKRLKNKINVPLKIIHIVRNPFDMITTQAYGGNEKQDKLTPELIQKATDFCFEKLNTINRLINSKQYDIFTLKHEELLNNPGDILNTLFNWLQITPGTEYLKACENHLYKKPHKSREKYNWSAEEKKIIQKRMTGIDFLAGYHFES